MQYETKHRVMTVVKVMQPNKHPHRIQRHTTLDNKVQNVVQVILNVVSKEMGRQKRGNKT